MFFAVLLSFGAGITNVTARTCNARLSDETSPVKSTFYNYCIGLFCSIAVLLAVWKHGTGLLSIRAPGWAYLGGLIGVVVILLSNITVSKISSFIITLFLFVGQVLTGVLLDVLLTGSFSWGNFLGGICVAIGLAINLKIDKLNLSQNINFKAETE